MVLGKLWKVYRPSIENWIVGLLQPVIDNLHKPDYVNRVKIRQFNLGEEPLSIRNVERRTSRRANDLHKNHANILLHIACLERRRRWRRRPTGFAANCATSPAGRAKAN